MARRRRFKKRFHDESRICPLCQKPTKHRCRYCSKWFCGNHSTPRGLLEKSRNIKLIREYDPTLGHACHEYIIKSREEEKERGEKYEQALNRWGGSVSRPESHEGFFTHSKPNVFRGTRHHPDRGHRFNIRIPRIRVNKYFRNPIAWYLIYIAFIAALNHLTLQDNNLYTMIAPYFQYPFYIASTFLGAYIPYRLFRHFEHKEPGSDLHIWLWSILSGVFALVSTIILIFGMVFLFSSLLAAVGKEMGYGITIFFGVLFIGMMLFSGYLFFKYKLKSGIIVHRGAGW